MTTNEGVGVKWHPENLKHHKEYDVRSVNEDGTYTTYRCLIFRGIKVSMGCLWTRWFAEDIPGFMMNVKDIVWVRKR